MPLRNWKEVQAVLREAQMTPNIYKRALEIMARRFARTATCEVCSLFPKRCKGAVRTNCSIVNMSYVLSKAKAEARGRAKCEKTK